MTTPGRRSRRRHIRVTRDLVLFTAGLAWFTYDLVFGGADPGVLTVCAGILVSPIMFRIEEWPPRRRNRDET